MEIRRIRGGEGRRLKEVRLAALADAPAAFATTFEDEAAADDGTWEERAVRRSTGLTEATFVAEVGGRLVGMAGGFVDAAGPWVNLVSMWTAPEARRAGVARALVEAVGGWAREIGAEELQLWVRADNEAANALYESAGFADAGDFRPLPDDPCRHERRMSRRL
ncbi:MAG: GNAT family N-acetyltransferase [Acidimicrobiales bacterium]